MRSRKAWILVVLGLVGLVLLAGAISSLGVVAQGPQRVLYPVKSSPGGDKGAGAARPAPQGWRAMEPVTYENLSVFPVLARDGADTSGFLTLDEGLASGDVVVTEQGSEIIRRTRDGREIRVPQGASVNQLVLINRSKKPLVLLAGEVVSGGKQDRVIAKDRIVAPGADPLPLDVFCVERGRWSAGARFDSSEMIVHPSVREKAAVEQKQDEVWAAVRSGTTSRPAGATLAPPARISNRTLDSVVAAEAQSESYAKIYTSPQVGRSVETFAAEVERRFERATKGRRVVGVVIAYGGEIAWADVFASPQLFETYWRKLLRSYVVEALARPQLRERAVLDDAQEFLEPLTGRENIETEPGVYRWRQITEGRYAEIALEAFAPKTVTLHWMKLQRTS